MTGRFEATRFWTVIIHILVRAFHGWRLPRMHTSQLTIETLFIITFCIWETNNFTQQTKNCFSLTVSNIKWLTETIMPFCSVGRFLIAVSKKTLNNFVLANFSVPTHQRKFSLGRVALNKTTVVRILHTSDVHCRFPKHLNKLSAGFRKFLIWSHV